ncbi:beta-1,4-galactosyltransferase 1 isoform X3 [Physeter macrocephalus]|uniref:Beta-1,4-galactosyltransferase n=2 Tax=Cetacea TaxID=9721 RepID=A0A9W2WVM2_PHYMC|nr:beta-1,4-galactosyltransferase 1 isoform X3 [Physeter catodon]
MRFREPLLGGSAAMPGASLQRACRLLVAVCALHLGVTLVYYLVGRDLSRLPQLVGVPTPLQGSSNGAAAIGQPSGELRPRGAAPPPPLRTSSKPRLGGASNPDADSRPGPGPGPGPGSNLTSAPVPPATALSLPACPEESPLLVGPMLIEFNIPVDLKLVEEQNPKVKVGGRYTPKDCISPHKVAIIIPFRNRQEHLKYWLYYLHPILQRQQLDYGIYVINQSRLAEQLSKPAWTSGPAVPANTGHCLRWGFFQSVLSEMEIGGQMHLRNAGLNNTKQVSFLQSLQCTGVHYSLQKDSAHSVS